MAQKVQVVLIDDNPRCIAAAEKLGMATIVFESAAKTERKLSEILGNKKLA